MRHSRFSTCPGFHQTGLGSAWVTLRQPQTADQLVEVPTIVSCSSLHGNVEQNANIPVPPGCVGVRGLQGFSSEFGADRSHSSSARWPARPSSSFSSGFFKSAGYGRPRFFFSHFSLAQKKSAKIPRTQQCESAPGVELMFSMSLAGVLACFMGNDMGCDYSFWLLLADRFGLVRCSSWYPLLPSGPEVFAGVD